MDPSSLIFVVIMGVWAVYLLGHWVRRRDMLATARSIDRFSEAMRVLERRPPQPLAGPQSRGYVVPPVRLAMAAAPAAVPEATAQAVRTRVVAPSTSRRRPARPDAASNRARALVLVALLVLVPLTWVVAMVTTVPGWLPLVLTVALVVHVVRLRRAAMRQRTAARRATRPDRTTPQQGARGGARPSTRRLPRSRPAPAHGGARGAEGARSATEVGAARSPAGLAGRHRAEASANDGDGAPDDRAPDDRARDDRAGNDRAHDETGNGTGNPAWTATGHAPQATDHATPPADDESEASRRPITVEGSWQPVPVPPPTYTLKPKAPAPVRRPVATASSVAAPGIAAGTGSAASRARDGAVDGHTSTFDLDAILERRIASGG